MRESPAQEIRCPPLEDIGESCEQSFAATSDLVVQFAVMDAGSALALDAGATANLVCYSWLEGRNSMSERRGVPRAEIHPACSRFKFGGGRLGEVQCAADVSAGIAGCRGELMAILLEAEIAAPLRGSALEALGGQSDSPETLRRCVNNGLISRKHA